MHSEDFENIFEIFSHGFLKNIFEGNIRAIIEEFLMNISEEILD